MSSVRVAKTVLVVDDSATIRSILATVLRDGGWHVLLAGDGSDALDVITGRTVDLVITDVTMPRMDGITLIEQLRAMPALASIPILVLTTEVDDATKSRARDAGASGWLCKPVDGQAIAGAVAALLA